MSKNLAKDYYPIRKQIEYIKSVWIITNLMRIFQHLTDIKY